MTEPLQNKDTNHGLSGARCVRSQMARMHQRISPDSEEAEIVAHEHLLQRLLCQGESVNLKMPGTWKSFLTRPTHCSESFKIIQSFKAAGLSMVKTLH